jgi:predicted transcriptional regulator
MLKLVEAFTKFTDIPKKDKRALCTVRTQDTARARAHTAHARTHSHPWIRAQSIRDVFMVEGEQPAAVAEAESEAAGGKGAKKGAKKESEKESGRVFDLKGLLEVKSVVRDAPTKPAFGKKKKRYRVSCCVACVSYCVSFVRRWST